MIQSELFMEINNKNHIDVYGHVHNTNYLKYFDIARDKIHGLIDISDKQLFEKYNIGLLISQTKIRYKKELNLGDSIKICSSLYQESAYKLRLDHELIVNSNIIASCVSVQVFVDFSKPIADRLTEISKMPSKLNLEYMLQKDEIIELF